MLAGLTTLCLSENSIETLKANSFRSLNSLEHLNLTEFPAENAQDGAFHGLNNLKTLKLFCTDYLDANEFKSKHGLKSSVNVELIKI
jgi:hypothetical protein